MVPGEPKKPARGAMESLRKIRHSIQCRELKPNQEPPVADDTAGQGSLRSKKFGNRCPTAQSATVTSCGGRTQYMAAASSSALQLFERFGE